MHELFHQFFTYTDSHELDCDVNSRQSSVIRFFFRELRFSFTTSSCFQFLISLNSHNISTRIVYFTLLFLSLRREPKNRNQITGSSLFFLLFFPCFTSWALCQWKVKFFLYISTLFFLFLGSDQRQKPTHLHEIHG